MWKYNPLITSTLSYWRIIMTDSLKKKIIEDLEKTGFPLEVYVASELKKIIGWLITVRYI